jgi:sucrose-phosphate synthase
LPDPDVVQLRQLIICMISAHGLIRGSRLELGRDADTGGQTKYVVELARAVSEQAGVERVDLLTRLVDDPDVDDDYAQPVEDLGERARIVRIVAGPQGYLTKEALWDHLDAFVDNTIGLFRESDSFPDLLHSHYADAGYVASRISHVLGIPLVHTGHSLGRIKRARLIASGVSSKDVEERYAMTRRIHAEELTLATAERVITSTRQEIESQYERYDYYQPDQMRVIPPGTDLQRFHPPDGLEKQSGIAAAIARFLRDPDKPMILALSRPDPRKNIPALVNAFGEDAELREMANLVLIAGNRNDIDDLEEGAHEVITDILLAVDRHDLYGKVAYPKHHDADDVPQVYRLAAATGGVFVNPALTEPFGLTLIEAAASALPLVATEDGGPTDIIDNCGNGILINPLDTAEIAAAIKHIIGDSDNWHRMSESGIKGVREHYSWSAHAVAYLDMVRPIAERTTEPLFRQSSDARPTIYHDRALFTDIDQNLLGDTAALPDLSRAIREHRKITTFGIATGRRLDSALAIMKRHQIPTPDVLITSGGTEIYYAPKLTLDRAWTRHIEKNWTPKVVRRVLENVDGIELQPRIEQSRFKISYYIDPHKAPPLEEIDRMLRREDQLVNAIVSFGQYLDVLPIRASKGLALRHVAASREINLDRILVAGGSGADEDMMRGNTLAVVVGNRHHEELSALEDIERIYFAKAVGAGGILEAIEHYDFFGACQTPEVNKAS